VSNRTLGLNEKLHDYLLAVSLREEPLLARLREETSRLPEHNMQIAPEQGQFMALIVGLLGARRCLEVGVFTGYSSLAVARALPPDGQLVGCDVSEAFTRVARRYWQEAGVAERIDLRLGPALRTLEALIDDPEAGPGAFDFAFIDADKSNYLAYYEHCLTLVRAGGLIAIDNTLWNGAVADSAIDDADTRAIRTLNSALHADERIDLSLVPIGDGLTLCRVRD